MSLRDRLKVMRIVIASPLYPPDIAEPARYVKELAKRLAGLNTVEVVTYGTLPELILGVTITAVSKRQPLPMRLLRYTIALFRAVRTADVIYVQNGPSVELPLSLVGLFTRTHIIFHIADTAADARTKENVLLKFVQRLATRKAHIVRGMPHVRPEIYPFKPRPTEAFAAYEKSWDLHLAALREITHV